MSDYLEFAREALGWGISPIDGVRGRDPESVAEINRQIRARCDSVAVAFSPGASEWDYIARLELAVRVVVSLFLMARDLDVSPDDCTDLRHELFAALEVWTNRIANRKGGS